MNIAQENEKIQQEMREVARKLLKEKTVDVIIGYSQGTLPFTSSPRVIKKEEDVEELIWNNSCYINLAKYLVPFPTKMVEGKPVKLKVGIISKGCTARAVFHLAMEKKVDMEDITIIGILCNGILDRARIKREVGIAEIMDLIVKDDTIFVKSNGTEMNLPFQEYLSELCKTCKIKAPPNSESTSQYIVGESQPATPLEYSFEDLAEHETKSPEEKFEFVKSALKDCIRCYACREACPMCYCNYCFVDQNLPIWFGKTTELVDIMLFHMNRVLHLAGRCVACGACQNACPMGINLNFINRKLEEIVKRRFDFTSGLDLETIPTIMTYEMNDDQGFMLGEEE
ncbi:MAG: 4Fe-4S ferredoxin [Promethearchaeota archaeon]